MRSMPLLLYAQNQRHFLLPPQRAQCTLHYPSHCHHLVLWLRLSGVGVPWVVLVLIGCADISALELTTRHDSSLVARARMYVVMDRRTVCEHVGKRVNAVRNDEAWSSRSVSSSYLYPIPLQFSSISSLRSHRIQDSRTGSVERPHRSCWCQSQSPVASFSRSSRGRADSPTGVGNFFPSREPPFAIVRCVLFG